MTQEKAQFKPLQINAVRQHMIKQYIQPEEAVCSQKLPADLKAAKLLLVS